jgi:hypothetical protein
MPRARVGSTRSADRRRLITTIVGVRAALLHAYIYCKSYARTAFHGSLTYDPVASVGPLSDWQPGPRPQGRVSTRSPPGNRVFLYYVLAGSGAAREARDVSPADVVQWQNISFPS